MKNRSILTVLLMLLVVSSLGAVHTLPSEDKSPIQQTTTLRKSYVASEGPDLSPPDILVYTEYIDDGIGEEYDNTMTAINNTYGTDYQYSNLSDYLDLSTELPGKDILLIPEQEEANVTEMMIVGAAWASALYDFVDAGGVVVLLDFGNESNPGLGLHIYNESGIMQFGAVIGAYPGPAITEMHRHTFGNPLCRRIEYQFTPRNNTFAVENTDGINAIDDYSTDNRIGIHKTIGHGHVVFLGFDMHNPDANYEQIVGNAIRLPNTIIIDDTQDTESSWEFPPPHIDGFQLGAWVDDLVEDGFAVGRLDTWDTDLLNASEVFICPIPYWTQDYGVSEIADIDEYVTSGGSVLIFSDWGSYGDEIRALANNFGYDWKRDSLWDTDDSLNHASRIAYTGDNLITHSITANISRVEFYAGDGFTTLPANAEKVIVSDWDGTPSWGTAGTSAEGVTNIAVSTYGSGRVCVILDSNFFDGTEDTDNDLTDDYFDSDNAQLLMNTARWLAGGGPADAAPQTSDLSHTPVSPLNGEAVTVSVNITDDVGIGNATCHYRANGGSWTNVTMTPGTGDTYTAAIGSFSETDDVEYYIRSFDASLDEYETVSDIAFFTVPNQIPSAPVMIDPGTTDDDGFFSVNWIASTDPDGVIDRYELQMSNASTFTHILDEWNSTDTTEPITGLLDDDYFFRVRAVDDHEALSLWSNVENMTVDIPFVDSEGPSFLGLTHMPSNPKQGESVTITVNATDVSDVKNVTCYYRVNSGAWQSVAMTNDSTAYEATVGPFSVDDVIDYYVKAFDNSAWLNEATSSTQQIQIDNQAPTEPTLNDPGNVTYDSHVWVNWTAGTDWEDAIEHYQLQISSTDDFSTILGEWNTSLTSYNITGLQNGTYFIQVRTVDDHYAVSAWSNVETIDVIVEATTTTTTTAVPTTTTPPTTSPTGIPTIFDPVLMSLIPLVVVISIMTIIILLVSSILKQRQQRRYQF